MMERPEADTGVCVPFGPYRGESVEAVAVMDPDYLLDLIGEAIGPTELRAEAARALAARGKLAGPAGVSVPWPRRAAAAGRNVARSPRARRLLAVAAVAGLATVALARGWVPGTAGADRPCAVGGTGADTTVSASGPPNLAGDPPGSRSIAADVAGIEVAGRRGSAWTRSGTVPVTTTVPVTGTVATDAAGAAPCGARVPGAIPAESAGDFAGTFQAVEFRVVRTRDTGKVTFLNSRDPYQGHFYVAVFPDTYADFPSPPAAYFAGRCIVVQGTIEMYRGAPQIVLRGPDDVRLVGD